MFFNCSRFLFLFIALKVFAQQVNAQLNDSFVIDGYIRSEDAEVLPYSHIINMSTKEGTIANEDGYFSLLVHSGDSLQFRSMGYETLALSVEDIQSDSIVVLKETFFRLNEALVLSGELLPEEMIKRVVENYEANYPQKAIKQRVFIRFRNKAENEKLAVDMLRSTHDTFNDDLIESLTGNLRKTYLSFTDFYGWLYLLPLKKEKEKFILKSIQTVELKEKEMYDNRAVDSLLRGIFLDDDDETHWKFRSGILPVSVEFNEKNSLQNDSIELLKARLLALRVHSVISQSRLDDKSKWEFLHKLKNYTYTLDGSTLFNDELVYIIRFEPKKDGLFDGRMFVTAGDFALVRADYAFAQGKFGRDIRILGVGYTENNYRISVQFDPFPYGYHLKYLAVQSVENIKVDRPLTMVKKRKRFLFDKSTEKVKLNLDLALKNTQDFEMIVFQSDTLSHVEGASLSVTPLNVLEVDRFTDSLWLNYPIIEPTEQMRRYRKSKD